MERLKPWMVPLPGESMRDRMHRLRNVCYRCGLKSPSFAVSALHEDQCRREHSYGDDECDCGHCYEDEG